MGEENAATLDNFDDVVGSQDFGDPGDVTPDPAGGMPGERAKSSLFDAVDEPAPGVDPVTGREVDGPPGIEEPGDEDDDGQIARDDIEETEETTEAPEDIFGVSQEDVLAALKDGKIPQELLEHLTIGDGEEAETLQEAMEGRMRHLDYSRKTRELAAERRDFDQAREDFVGMASAWKGDSVDSRRSTRRQLEMLGVPLREIAADIADEEAMLESMTPDQRNLWQSQRQHEIELSRREQELKAREARAGQQGGDSVRDKNASLFQKQLPSVMKGLGVPETANTKRMLLEHLQGFYTDRTKPMTRDMLVKAARATKEELRELGMDTKPPTNGKAAPAPTQQRRPGLNPRPQAGATAGKGGRRRAKQDFVASPDNFDDWLERGAR